MKLFLLDAVLFGLSLSSCYADTPPTLLELMHNRQIDIVRQVCAAAPLPLPPFYSPPLSLFFFSIAKLYIIRRDSDHEKQRDIVCDSRRPYHIYGAKRKAVQKNYESVWEHGGYLTVKSKKTSRISCKKDAGIFVINEVGAVFQISLDISPPPPFIRAILPPLLPLCHKADVLKTPSFHVFLFCFCRLKKTRAFPMPKSQTLPAK